jgi:hypothetical protein
MYTPINIELASNNYTELPIQPELIRIASVIRDKISSSVTYTDLAFHLRRRFQSSQREQSAPVPLFSYFKQFAEPAKQEEPKERQEYVCRSKRKLRPADPAPKRQLEEMVEYCDSNTADCHILFERKNRKNSAQQTQGTLH